MKNWNKTLCALALSVGTLVSLIPNARATTLTYTNSNLEMMLCFRQLGTANPFDLEVNLGSVTNLIALSVGTTITNTQFTLLQLSNAMASGTFDNVAFSVTAAQFAASNTTTLATAVDTIWATIPRSDPGTTNTPWVRESKTTLGFVATRVDNIGNLASSYSGSHVADPLVNNNPVVGIPPGSTFSCEVNLGANGDVNGTYFVVENDAPSPFSSAIVSDFFMEVPKNSADPLNGNALTGNSDYLGYFTFYPSGMLTFTRATATSSSGPPPQPTLTITRTNNTSTISFGTTNGATYSLLVTNRSGLGAPRTNWFAVGSPITGNGGNTNFTDTTTDSNRVYSVSAH